MSIGWLKREDTTTHYPESYFTWSNTVSEELAKLTAYKYACDVGHWCRIYYCVCLCPDLQAVKDYIRVLRE